MHGIPSPLDSGRPDSESVGMKATKKREIQRVPDTSAYST
jgi:hypothetical protein